MKFKISSAKKADLIECAKILRDIYNSNVLNEDWTEETSLNTCNFFFKLNPDLFFVAKSEDGKVVGFTYSFIKPWSDGNQLMIEEISVDENFRCHGIAKALLTRIIEEAKNKYNITKVNGSTYYGDNNMPFAWYERIGFTKLDDLFLIEAKTQEVLDRLSK